MLRVIDPACLKAVPWSWRSSRPIEVWGITRNPRLASGPPDSRRRPPDARRPPAVAIARNLGGPPWHRAGASGPGRRISRQFDDADAGRAPPGGRAHAGESPSRALLVGEDAL